MKNYFWHQFQRFRIWYSSLRPTYALVVGIFLYAFVTFVLLSLPICRKNSDVPLIDALFMALSVSSTAGLQVVSVTDTYNGLGQFIILVSIQCAGLGYMTLGSIIILASKGHLSKNRLKVGKAVLSMPESFDPVRFLKHIAVFTLSFELIGAFVLWLGFRAAGTPNPLWAAIFHAISSFCTAGISVFPDNLEPFADNVMISLTISLLCLLGGIGFIVLEDFYRSIKYKSVRATLTTRIILVATFGALFVGTAFLFFDPYIASFPLKKRFLVAFFQTVSSLTTTGFHTVPISNLTGATVVIVIILMTLGPSPSGTGGGLKTTTWSAALAAILSFVRGSDEITFFRNKVPQGRITAAFATITLYLIALAIGTYCLLLADTNPFECVLFEVAAALSLCGLSYSITPELSTTGKTIIILMMYVGRLGVVSLALGAVALYHDMVHDSDHSAPSPPPPLAEDDIVL